MPTAQTCPDRAQYRRLASGELLFDESEAILRHLEKCPRCAERLDTAAEPDTLDDLARQARTLGDGPSAEVIARLVEKLKALRPASSLAAPSVSVTFACSGCGKTLKVGGELAGKQVRCPQCKQVVPVPASESVKPPAPNQVSSVVEKVQQAPSLTNPSESVTPPPSPDVTCDIPVEPSEDLTSFLAPAQAPDELGRLGAYRVLKVLGYGGMGVVYRAEDPQLKRSVALKAMLPGLASRASSRERFLREARAAAKVKHDHVVAIYQVGEDRGAPFLAMEFLEGEPLDARLEREAKLPIAEVMRIGREMADGLAAAHEQGLIHRDVKPANTWLEGKRRRVKLLDFGLARAADDASQITQSGAIVGTPAYMAPEQARGDKIDGRCDLFSLGCVLYRMATGEMPFRGPDTVSTLLAVATQDPTPPQMMNFEVPAELSDLIMQLLEKDPGKRPASAREVEERLTQIEKGEVQPAAPVPPAVDKASPAKPEARKRQPLSRKVLVAAAVLGLIVLGGVIVLNLRTDGGEGTVKLEVAAGAEDDIEVIVRQGGKVIEILDKKSKQSATLRAGTYEVELKAGKDGLKLVTDRFTLKRGDTEIVRVTVDLAGVRPPGKTVKGDAKVITPPDPDKTPGKTVASPFDRFRKEDIPEKERFAWQPRELVAVFGEHSRRNWASDHSSVGFAFGGKAIVSGNSDKLRIWDIATGIEKSSVDGVSLPRFNVGHPSFVVFSPDGQMFATTQAGKGVALGDVRSGIRGYLKHGGTWNIVFSPNGKIIASVDGAGTLKWWDAVTEKELGTIEKLLPGFGLSISPDNQTLAVFGKEESAHPIILIDLASRKQTRIRNTATKHNHYALAFSPDGKMLACGDGVVWDLAAGKERVKLDGYNDNSGGSLIWSPDSTLVSGRFRDDLLIWHAVTGKLQTTLHRVGPSAAWSRNGKFIASAWGSHPLLWDTRVTSMPLELAAARGSARALAYSSDNQLLVTAGEDGKVRVWNLPAGDEKHAIDAAKHEVLCLAVTPSGTILGGTRGGKLLFWNAKGELERTLDGHVGWVQAIAYSEASNQFASASKDGTVKLWDAKTGKEIHILIGHTGPVHAVAFSSDGKRIATGGEDKAVRLFDAATGKEQRVLTGHSRAVLGVAFSPKDATLVSGSEDGTARLWDVASGQELQQFNANVGAVRGVAIAPDGKSIATAGQDGTVRLWLPGMSFEWITLHGHVGPVASIDFAPDGKTIASAGQDGKVLVRQTASPVPGWEYPPQTAEIKAMSSDGKLLLMQGFGKAFLMETATGKVRPSDVELVKHPIDKVRFAPDNRTLAFNFIHALGATPSFRWLDVNSGKDKTAEGGGAFGFCFSSDGRYLGNARGMWDMNTGTAIARWATACEQCAIHGETKTFVIFSHGQKVQFWDIPTGTEKATKNPAWGQVVLAPNGATFVARPRLSAKGNPVLWDVVKDEERASLSEMQFWPTYSPDSKLIAAPLNEDQKSGGIFDTANGKLIAKLGGHTAQIRGWAFAPDGKQVASWADDNRVILWNVADGKQLRSWSLPGVCKNVLFTPDGRHLIFNNSNDTVYILRLNEVAVAEKK